MRPESPHSSSRRFFPGRGEALLLLLLSGCSNYGQVEYEGILAHPSGEWSDQDRFMVTAIPAANNYFDRETYIRVSAIPYYPSVVVAVQRSAQKLNHWSEETFRANTDTLMADAAGMYVDWQHNRLVDSRGFYFRDKAQIDAVEFLITI